jgi:hypothetical protein
VVNRLLRGVTKTQVRTVEKTLKQMLANGQARVENSQ